MIQEIIENEDWQALHDAIEAGDLVEIDREESAIIGAAEVVNYVTANGELLHTVRYLGERPQILPGHGSL